MIGMGLRVLALCAIVFGSVGFVAHPAASETRFNFTAAKPDPDPRLARQTVRYVTDEAPGTIIVDTRRKYLFFILGDNQAIRYGVGVGREGMGWTGTARIGRKAEWPTWTPTRNMIQREPHLAEYVNGMPGGPRNPLGARALYLYQGAQDTMIRLHGTNEPWSIGRNVSSGCIRLLNEDIIDLYERARVGARVIVQ